MAPKLAWGVTRSHGGAGPQLSCPLESPNSATLVYGAICVSPLTPELSPGSHKAPCPVPAPDLAQPRRWARLQMIESEMASRWASRWLPGWFLGCEWSRGARARGSGLR